MATKKKAAVRKKAKPRKKAAAKKRATKKKAAPRKKAAAKPKAATARFKIGSKYKLDGQLMRLKRKSGNVAIFDLINKNGTPKKSLHGFFNESTIISRRLSEVKPA